MQIAVDHSEGVRVLNLKGDLLKEEAADLIETLVAALGNSDYVVIHMKDIGSIDPYFLSQICTAYKISLRLKKKIILTGEMDEVLQMMNSHRKEVCTTDLLPICAAHCIWRMQGNPAEKLKEIA